jgi:CxC2 like cysteine cluster associated with KDZ transposases
MMKREEYLQERLKMEAPPAHAPLICQHCKIEEGVFRCESCLGWPLLCKPCCLNTHQRHPYHKIKQWTGKWFNTGSLFDLGFSLYLGHNGLECPSNSQQCHQEEITAQHKREMLKEDEREELKEDILVIVDSSGVHKHRVRWCTCGSTNPGDKDLQLFKMGLFPASFTKPSTAFTFQVLDDFYMDAMECKTSAMNFFNKLRRLTNNAFPKAVPVSHLNI